MNYSQVKKSHVHYAANKGTIHFANLSKKRLDVIFQVSVMVSLFVITSRINLQHKENYSRIYQLSFRYFCRAFLQPMQKAKSGWEKTNPAYEEDYVQDMPVGTPSPTGAGWVYPALFHVKDGWALITEASMDGTYCASRLTCSEGSGEYLVSFPDEKETIHEDGLLPRSITPWYSPWRIILTGSLKTIIESTLGTDLAAPALKPDTSFIIRVSHPGAGSCQRTIPLFTANKRVHRFAADMHWNYCLIDVNWDRKIGYDKIKELADYGASKKVGLILWSIQPGDWNYGQVHS